MYTCLQVKYSCQILIKLFFILEKSSNIKIMKIQTGRMDGQKDKTKLVVHFRNFTNSPRNERGFTIVEWLSHPLSNGNAPGLEDSQYIFRRFLEILQSLYATDGTNDLYKSIQHPPTITSFPIHHSQSSLSFHAE